MITKKIFVVGGEYDYGHTTIHRAFSTRKRANEWMKAQQTEEQRKDPYCYKYFISVVEYEDYTKVKKNV